MKSIEAINIFTFGFRAVFTIIICCVFLVSSQEASSDNPMSAAKNETALENKEVDQKIGFFNNSEFQEILQKPFYLYHLDRQAAIPFFAEEYINQQHSLIKSTTHKAEIENPFYCVAENTFPVYCNLSQTFQERIGVKKVSEVFIDEQKVKKYLDSLSSDLSSNPKNGKLEISDKGKVRFSEEPVPGHRLNVEKSYTQITNALKEEITGYYVPLEMDEIEPEISRKKVENMQINEKIGGGESNFSGSTKNRIHNIKVGASKFHGTLINPGEEFSFIERLGDVDGEAGYKQELVIKGNTTIPEFGGGICQISTTMFRAALNAGLKITERRNHAYPVKYYNPPGTDATIYIPKPDLRFVNDTKNHLLIQTKIDEKKQNLFIDFYGKTDGRVVEIEGPTITERTSEGRIKAVLYQIVKNNQGEEVRRDTFKSSYDNQDNYPNPNDIFREKPEDWSNKQWDEYYAKYGKIIEQLKNQ